MQTEIVFTRYLYLKSDVEHSFIISLLQKKEESTFWAYELYFSGFKEETFRLLFKVYYDFFASLNPSFEAYLIQKYHIWTTTEAKDDRIIGTIVENLLVRPYNMDCYLIMLNPDSYSYSLPNLQREYTKWIVIKDHYAAFNKIINYFVKQGVLIVKAKAQKEFTRVIEHGIINGIQLLCSRMLYYCSLLKKLPLGKSVYIIFEEEEFETYKTLELEKPYQILSVAVKHSVINPEEMVELSISREKIDRTELLRIYREDWLYYASFSLLWFSRIENYGGKIDCETKKIVFQDDELEEAFYNKYDLEPDEQSLEVQESTFGKG